MGHSGSGKTTIRTLVPRFYDVQEGRITLGGAELFQISRQELKKGKTVIMIAHWLSTIQDADQIRLWCWKMAELLEKVLVRN